MFGRAKRESGYETQIFPQKIKKKWYDLQLPKIYTKMEAFLCNNISIFGKLLKNPGGGILFVAFGRGVIEGFEQKWLLSDTKSKIIPS